MTEDRARYIGEGEPMNDDEAPPPLVAWCRKRLLEERSALDGMKTGRFRMMEMQDGRRVDVTARFIAQTEASIAELERLLTRRMSSD
jgi:hypothetical protein